MAIFAARTEADLAYSRLVQRLQQQAEDLRRLVEGLDEATLAQPRTPGKWSIKQLICHLCRVQRVFEGRITEMLNEGNPIITLYDPEPDAEFEALVAKPISSTLAGYANARAVICAQLSLLKPEDWQRRGQHPQYPHFDVRFQIEAMLHHEAHHIYQIFQQRSQLGPLPS